MMPKAARRETVLCPIDPRGNMDLPSSERRSHGSAATRVGMQTLGDGVRGRSPPREKRSSSVRAYVCGNTDGISIGLSVNFKKQYHIGLHCAYEMPKNMLTLGVKCSGNTSDPTKGRSVL